MISADLVCKTFYVKSKKIEALKEVSFQCRKGEIFGLLGPNGAGKTTLLRILATIMKPTSGNITINGYDCIKNPQTVKKNVSYLSGETGVYDRFTPREILRFFGQINGVEKNELETRIDNIIRQMDMSEYADINIDRFSTGMRQKVSIARSLIHDPPVIIFDEPTNGLDVIAGRVVKDFLLKLKEQGKCIILSTHLMNDIDELCDTIGIIYKGKLVITGNKEEIKKRYNSPNLENTFFKIIGDAYET